MGDLVSDFGPHEGMGAVGPAVKEETNLAWRIFDGSEGSAVDYLPSMIPTQTSTRSDHNPGGRAEVDLDARIGFQPVADLRMYAGLVLTSGAPSAGLGGGSPWC